MAVWLGLGLLAMGCADREQEAVGESQSTTRISDADTFDQLLASAGDRLLVIDFFADWCAPCKALAPILEKVASETKDFADFYTVDVDANRKLAQRMGVSGIPNLLLIKNGKILDRLRGVLPKETYLAAIRKASR
jgi:thioredoxin 1